MIAMSSQNKTYTDNQLQKAVALFYDGHQAPKVTAKGFGDQADEIISIARDCDIPLCDNSALVDLLMTLELGDEIPEVLYTAVAHIIAFAHQLFPAHDRANNPVINP